MKWVKRVFDAFHLLVCMYMYVLNTCDLKEKVCHHGSQGLCQSSDRRNLAKFIAHRAPFRLLAMRSHMDRLNEINRR